MALNFDTIELHDMSDEELSSFESNGSGRKGIYPDVWNGLRKSANGERKFIVVPFADVNDKPEIERDTVVAGLTAAAKRLEKKDKSVSFKVTTMTDDALIKLGVVFNAA